MLPTCPNPLVSIIIPTYNKWELTEQCLRTLRDTVSHLPVEVIVADNASKDGTPGQILDRFPDVRLLAFERNFNFSGGCNAGADVATGEYLVFLNNDTIPFEGWLEPLIAELRLGTGVVGSKLVYPDGTIQHAGVAFMRETRFPYHPYRGGNPDSPVVNHRRYLQVVTGACMATPRDLFDKLGRFNNDYRNGGEDIEYCLAARAAGRSVVYQPESALIHLESQSPGRLDYNEENTEVFFRNWGGPLLSDEDNFFFEDGLHRVGYRRHLDETPLAQFASEDEVELWKRPSELQRLATDSYNASCISVLEEHRLWPLDESLREWAGNLCRTRYKAPEAGMYHFYTALQLRKIREFNAASQTMDSSLISQFKLS